MAELTAEHRAMRKGPREIYADWCEENGLAELGLAQRWMGLTEREVDVVEISVENCYTHWGRLDHPGYREDDPCKLPREVLRLLPSVWPRDDALTGKAHDWWAFLKGPAEDVPVMVLLSEQALGRVLADHPARQREWADEVNEWRRGR